MELIKKVEKTIDTKAKKHCIVIYLIIVWNNKNIIDVKKILKKREREIIVWKSKVAFLTKNLLYFKGKWKQRDVEK